MGPKNANDADFLIAETEVGVREYLDIDPTLNPDKIIIISPPFDTDEFKNLPQKGTLDLIIEDPSDKVIMFLGRVHHIKGNDFLIMSRNGAI